jgi:ribosomal protein S12 methylthiotransferase accessory factor
MTTSLFKAHTRGTHRLIPPERTLGYLQHHAQAFGVTRCADVTGLDHLGIPVFSAIRPRGRLLQVANGKGLDPTAARVSALMEAVEFFHYEQSSESWQNASFAAMRREGRWAIEPSCLAEYRVGCFYSPDYVIDWEPGEELLTAREAWLPASAVRIRTPMLYPFSSNGLASGNHLVEATLHGLYEVIERDAVSRLSSKGRIRVEQPQCRSIDLDTVDNDSVGELIEKIRHANMKLVLIWIESCLPVHTFWAILLDKNPFSHCSAVNIGYGTHLSVSVAATRAITEAAQTRLTFIHGAREDLNPGTYQASDWRPRLLAFFDDLECATPWQSFTDLAGTDLLQDYHWLLQHLAAGGYRNIFRVTLTQPPLNIPVVKVLVPGLQFNGNLF